MIGADTRQTGLTSRRRGRAYHPSRQRPVELDARRRARPVRERLLEVIPPTRRCNLQTLSHNRVAARMRASGTRRGLQCPRSVLAKAGGSGQAARIPRRGSDHSPSGPNRVQGSRGSINARWRRESGGGNTDRPEADNLRGSAQTADREQLNDERGVKPLPVNDRGDGAEPVKLGQDG